MDLDGTSVHSEEFWMYIIERTMAGLLKNPKFTLEQCDVPYVSGHSVSEHLLYYIEKYAPDKTVEEARLIYTQTTEYEMNEILHGRGKEGAFTPAPYLKEFLMELKARDIKIGLVTSGLYVKAMPEIISAFKTLNMGDPVDFYDAIITAGTALIKGQTGTIGELAPKPHPWLYAETARVGHRNCFGGAAYILYGAVVPLTVLDFKFPNALLLRSIQKQLDYLVAGKGSSVEHHKNNIILFQP